MKRVVTWQETLAAAVEQKKLQFTITRQVSRRKKRTLSSSVELCYGFLSRSAAKTVYESGGDMMNVNSLKAVCNLEKKVFRLTPLFKSVCRQNRKTGQCCASFSLGNYIADIRNRTSCGEITESDVSFMKDLLRNCSSLYFSGKLQECGNNLNNCSVMCARHAKFLEQIFTYVVDRDFLKSSDVLKYTMVVTPVYVDNNFFSDVYKNHLDNDQPEENGVKLVAFNLRDFKFDQFNRQLLLDAVFPVIGLIVIALILLVYTHSAVVMLLTVLSVMFSVILSYFFYHFIFRLKFFPFLNLTTFIFLVGIGADNAFVFTDVWKHAKLASPRGTLVEWMEYTLKHAAVSMFVTSLTTSSAFYANIVSDITAIRLFGIFAGSAILINYALMITWFPAGIIVLEKRTKNLPSTETFGSERNEIIPLECVREDAARTFPDYPASTHVLSPDSTSASENAVKQMTSKREDTSPADGGPDAMDNQTNCCNFFSIMCRFYSTLRSKCSQFVMNLFGMWIPKSLSFFVVWVFVLLALGIGMLCAVTVSPGLQRPSTDDFQVFSSSHPLEQYNLKYKQKFRADSNVNNNFWVYVFMGIKAEDNGNFLDPSDYGHLLYDTSFNITSPEAQVWLQKLCSHIKNQTFFDKKAKWSCFIHQFIDFMAYNRCTVNHNDSFPYAPEVLLKCSAELQARYGSENLLFDRKGNLKVLRIEFPTNVPFTNEYDKVDKLWERIQSFSSEVLDNAPPGVQNGWSVTWLRFYALQKNLGSGTVSSLGVSLAISFAVMLLTTVNWVISVYAIVTIICILSATIGSLVLAGWELNILESLTISVAVGLSVDFTLHYGVAYSISNEKGRTQQVKYALSHIGPAVTLASITTFIAGENLCSLIV